MDINQEKMCLKWKDFQTNINLSLKDLRSENNFADVTLVCEDNQLIETHKIILAASSSFFKSILTQNKHTHPLIYMKGIKSMDLAAIVDFMYYGEVQVYQEDLANFLAIAEELKLNGLTGVETIEENNDTNNLKQISKPYKTDNTNDKVKDELVEDDVRQTMMKKSEECIYVVSSSLDELDEKINSMMVKDEGLWACIPCGKRDKKITNLKTHIEGIHIKGLLHSCATCEKKFRSRHSLTLHIMRIHRYELREGSQN